MILLLKLNDGTEIIATTEELENRNVYRCVDVVQIVTRAENNQMTIGLVPFMPYADSDAGVLIPTNMAMLAIPSKELLERYNKIFSKIIVPESKIVLS